MAYPTGPLKGKLSEKGNLQGGLSLPPAGMDGFSPIVDIEKVDDATTITITDRQGEHSAVIYDGKDGEQGAQGPAGPKGDAFVYSDFTPEQLAGLTGPQGPQGIQGEQGIQGIQGIQGEKGEQGEQGAQGIQGPAGNDGVSPTLSSTKVGKVTTIYYTDKTHTSGTDVLATINDGQDGGGSGDMLKSTYDTDNSGVVDDAEALGGTDASFYADAVENHGMGYSVETSVIIPETTLTEDMFLYGSAVFTNFAAPIEVGKTYRVTIGNQVYEEEADDYGDGPSILLGEDGSVYYNPWDLLVPYIGIWMEEPLAVGTTVKIELADAEEMPQQIASEFLPPNMVSAVENNGMGYVKGTWPVFDVELPAAEDWDVDGWYASATISSSWEIEMWSGSVYRLTIKDFSWINTAQEEDGQVVFHTGGYEDIAVVYQWDEGDLVITMSTDILPLYAGQTAKFENLNVSQIPSAFIPPPQVDWNDVINTPAGIDAAIASATYYVRCTTPYNTAEKSITIPELSSIPENTRIRVSFAPSSTSGSPGNNDVTLRVNNGRAASIFRRVYGSPSILYSLMAKEAVFKGGSLILLGSDSGWTIEGYFQKATDTDYGEVMLSSAVDSSDEGTVATSYAVKQAYDLADSKQDEITASGVLQGDGQGGITAKTVDTTPSSGSSNLITSGAVYAAILGAMEDDF